ncbi:flagellar protein FlgJ [Sphingomonas vulcanisoli]|uniref:Flagellar protein FlgJ n=1 Tax=Sphingomonas vulcanisoli TaxID=1658060 RepID=A0ABX0TZD0_9SPHN|nr:flagellar protein FlgJ [Sphingomonas vulcanisoli]
MTDAIASTTAVKPATPAANPEQEKLKKAAKAFEAIFVRQMIGSMRTASLGDGIMDSDSSQQFRDMSDAKMADQIAEKGGLHIADMLIKQYGARVSGTATADKGGVK